MNSRTNADDVETTFPTSLQALFGAALLQVPPVPVHLAVALKPEGPTLLATRALQETPYDMDHYLLEFEANPGLPAYAVVGFDGHGINSWAVHYYLVDDGLALFMQLPWGGVYLDAEPARAEIADMFDWAARLQAKVSLAHEQRRIAVGQRLQVAASRFTQAGWRWLEPSTDPATVPWNPSAGMKAAIQHELDRILGCTDAA